LPKKKSKTSNKLSTILVIGLLAVLIFANQGSVEASPQLTFDVGVTYTDGTTLSDVTSLSVLHADKIIESVDVDVRLILQITGQVSSAVMDGTVHVMFDGTIKRSVEMSIPSQPTDNVYTLVSVSVLGDEIESWSAGSFTSHLLAFSTGEVSALTITFDDGWVDEKVFPIAYAELTVDYASDNSVDVADLIISPSYSEPEPTSSYENLGDIPDDWGLSYGSGPQIIGVDYSFGHDGKPSLTLAPHVEGVDVNRDREIDGTWYPVTPGDRVVASVWIWVGDSADGSTSIYDGGRFGTDWYAHSSVGFGIVGSRPNWGTMHGDSMVNWGTKQWVKKTWDFIIPDVYYTDIMTAAYWATTPCDPVQVDYIVFWLDVRSYTDAGDVYFSDCTINIIPKDVPTTGNYRLFLGKMGSGTMNLDVGAYGYSSGEQVTLTATPNAGSVFTHWLLFNEDSIPTEPYSYIIGSTPTITITMDNIKQITAVFRDINELG